MNLDFIQNLWLLKFVLKPKQDAEIDTVNSLRSSNNLNENGDSCKSPGLEFGIWEQFWCGWDFKKVVIHKPETCGTLKKTEPSKHLKEGFSDWHLPRKQFRQKQDSGKAINPRPEQHGTFRKPELINCMKEEGFGVWSLSWPLSPFAATSILGPRNNSINCNGKLEIRKPQQNRHQTFKLGIRDVVPWWINKNEVVSISNTNKSNSIGRVDNKSQQGLFPFWWINQADIARIHKLENKNNARKIENVKFQSVQSWFDKLNVWDLFQSKNQTETLSTPKSYSNKNSLKMENKSQQDRSYWVVLSWINQTETATIPGSEKKRNDRNLENRKSLKVRSLKDSFGVWELLWQKDDSQRIRLLKPDCNNRKTGSSQPLLDRFSEGRIGVWELFWQMYQRARGIISDSENVTNKVKLETMKPPNDRFSVWNVFWQINQNGTASNSGVEKNGMIENNKPLQDLFRVWENVQQIKLPWNVNQGKQAKNAETSKLEFETLESGCTVPKFTPYMASIPWHTGPRAFLSQMFPRYGNYCGPNWSSGTDNGGLLWDKKPIDWLDYCCYCHDIGYDTHDQADMLKADITFLECLEKSWVSKNKFPRAAEAYRSMCITGLKTVLIPYRQQLLKQMHAKRILALKISGLDRSTMQRQ